MDIHENDTKALFHALNSGRTIPEIFSQIQGEYAFVIFDVSKEYVGLIH